MTRSLNALPFGLAIWLCAITFVATSRVASAQEPPKNFVLLDKPILVAEINFDDGEGHARKLADFKGKVVLLNIWATWCIPCRKEMPALDRLQASLGGANFEVVPVSIDRSGLEVIRKFYIEVGIRNLALYVDSSGQVLGRVRALGLPTSLLIDRSGEESSDRPTGTRPKSSRSSSVLFLRTMQRLPRASRSRPRPKFAAHLRNHDGDCHDDKPIQHQ